MYITSRIAKKLQRVAYYEGLASRGFLPSTSPSAQLPGLPEICKKSLSSCPASGDRELFIVGKNFMKGTRVIFSQSGPDGQVIWEKNAEIDLEYFQQVKNLLSPIRVTPRSVGGSNLSGNIG